jgi:hypothetical protein
MGSKALADKGNYAPGTTTNRRRSTVVKSDLSTVAVEVAIDNRDAVYSFLVGRAGKPFRIDPYQNNVPDPRAWRCLEFVFRWAAPGLWIFAAEFEEVGGKWI